MKKLLFVFVIMAFLSSCIFAQASANSSMEKVKPIHEKNYLVNIPEKDDVISAFKKDENNLLENAKDYTEKSNVKYNLDNSLKLYLTKNTDIFNEYKSGKKFAELISDDCYYAIPITEESKNTAILLLEKHKKVDENDLRSRGLSEETIKMCKDQEGKIGLSQIRPIIKDEGYDFFTSTSKIVDVLDKNNISEISEMKVVTVPPLHIDFLFISTPNGEFGIPYASRPDFVKVNNGSLYKMDELINLFKRNVDTNNKPNEMLKFGGSSVGSPISSNTTQGNNYNTFYFIAIPALIAVAGLITLILVRRKRNSLASEDQ